MLLSSKQFLLLPHQPQNLTLDAKIVKNDLKTIISLQLSKSVKHTLEDIFLFF
jgi:hypothetical protein